MAIHSAVDAIIEASSHTHQWEILGNTNSGRFRCATCGQTTTAQARAAAERLAKGKAASDQRYTYDRGYEEGQADKKKGTQADVPFNSPHLLKRTQVQWGKGYVDGWSGKPKSMTEALPRSTVEVQPFLDKLWASMPDIKSAGQWKTTPKSVQFASRDQDALRAVRHAALRANLSPTSEPLMLSTYTLTISGFASPTLPEDLRKWFGSGKTGGVGGGGWDRYNTKGERIGKCGDADNRGGDGEGKPKCLSKEKAAQLRAQGGQQAIANAVKRKKAEDPVTNRAGTGNPPRPVSNRINESVVLSEKNVPTNPELWSRAKSEAKKRFDVYPSAYANGWAAKWYKERGGKWRTQTNEASEYQGRKVTLNKPFRTPGGPKKFSVYVRNEKGNVVKVNFGDPDLSIKRDDPERRKNFRARHGCDNPGPRWKAKYWSCRFWSERSVSDILK